MKDVIAKLKQQQNSLNSQVKTAPAPVKQEIPDPVEDEDEISEDEEQEQVDPKSTQVDASKFSKEEQIAMEIEMLQNNGRFRAELLHQMQEINRALIVIAGAFVNSKNN